MTVNCHVMTADLKQKLGDDREWRMRKGDTHIVIIIIIIIATGMLPSDGELVAFHKQTNEHCLNVRAHTYTHTHLRASSLTDTR